MTTLKSCDENSNQKPYSNPTCPFLYKLEPPLDIWHTRGTYVLSDHSWPLQITEQFV